MNHEGYKDDTAERAIKNMNRQHSADHGKEDEKMAQATEQMEKI